MSTINSIKAAAKAWKKKVKSLKFEGIDASLEISLLEYGVIAAPFIDDKAPMEDEYFVVYSIGNNRFDTGYLREKELNDLINGNEWMDENKIKSFLSCVGTNKDEFISTSFINKLYDLISYYGFEDLMGSSYSEGLTEKEVRKLYIK